MIDQLGKRYVQAKYHSKQADLFFPEILEFAEERCIAHRSITLRLQKDNSKITVSKQLRLEKAFQRFNLNDCEKEVVEALLAHYNRTGSPFIYINYAEDLQLDYAGDVLQEAFRKLHQDNIIYIWPDRSVKALKLGLKKAFLGTLELEALIKKVEETL